MLLHAAIEQLGDLTVVSCTGRADLASVPALHGALTRALTTGGSPMIAVDLDGVDVLDDTALGVLLGAAGRARSRAGDITVVCSSEKLRERFALTGLDRAIRVVANLSAVTASAQSPSTTNG